MYTVLVYSYNECDKYLHRSEPNLLLLCQTRLKIPTYYMLYCTVSYIMLIPLYMPYIMYLYIVYIGMFDRQNGCNPS